MPDSTVIILGNYAEPDAETLEKTEQDAKTIVEDAGCLQTEKHYEIVVGWIRNWLLSGMNRERALHEAITTTRNYRKADHDQAKAEADELRRTTYRMCQRRAKLDKLEEKLRDSGPDDQFFMILAEEMERNRMKDELEVRIKVERESMKRDEEFAREVMKNMAEELNGL